MLIQGSFLSGLLNLLPQKGMVKMIDCSKTENYFAEKRRMTKRAKNGLCKLGCSNCPLCSINNNKGQSCTAFEMLYPEKGNRNRSKMVGCTSAKDISYGVLEELSECSA